MPSSKVYRQVQAVDKSFLLCDQFRGSLGSSDGAGTRTTSLSVSECLTRSRCCWSINRTVGSNNQYARSLTSSGLLSLNIDMTLREYRTCSGYRVQLLIMRPILGDFQRSTFHPESQQRSSRPAAYLRRRKISKKTRDEGGKTLLHVCRKTHHALIDPILLSAYPSPMWRESG